MTTMNFDTHASTHRYLRNGMEICLAQNDFAPLVTLQILVKAGSIDERPGEEGMAHVLEHMLFKGTKQFPEAGLIASMVESSGGDINAYTTFDHTVYYMTVPEHFALQGARILFDVVSESLIDEQELARELEVIVEEIRRQRDNPSATVSQNLFKALFEGTLMARPVIGYEDIVKGFTRNRVHEFYKRWYVPNNMIFVASGSFSLDGMIAFLEETTTTFSAHSIAERQRPKLLSETTPNLTTSVVDGAFQEARVSVGVRAVTLDDPNLAKWDMFASLLGGAESSRLISHIKNDAQLVTSIDAWTYTPEGPAGVFAVSLYGQVGKVCHALDAVVSEIKQLAEHGPKQSEMTRVLAHLQASKIYSRESVEGIGRSLLNSLQTSKKLRFDEVYFSDLEKVTPADVQQIAELVLADFKNRRGAISVAVARESVTELTVENLENAIVHGCNTAIQTDEQRVHFNTAKSSSRNEHIRQLVIDLPFKKTLHVNFRESNRLPIASAVFVARGGLSLENEKQSGVAHLAAEMMGRGTVMQNYKSFVQELDDLAASVSQFSAKDLFGTRCEALTNHFSRAVTMMCDALFKPTFVSDEFQKALLETREVIRAQRDSASSRLARMNGPMLFGSHPYARPALGTLESIELLSDKFAVEYWQRFFQADKFVLSIAGQCDFERVIGLFAARFTEFLTNSEFSQATRAISEFNITPFNAADKRVGFDLFEREQAHLTLSARAFPVTDKRRTALEIAVNILGGQGGRLFLDLRDKRSLAYSLGASQLPFLQSGVLSTYIGTAAHKTQEALTGLKQHIERLAVEPPSAEELSRAQKSILGAQSMDAQHYHYQASQLAFSDVYNLNFDNFLYFEERVMAVTTTDVSQALRDVLENCPPVVSIAGPEGTWVPNQNDDVMKWSVS